MAVFSSTLATRTFTPRANTRAPGVRDCMQHPGTRQADTARVAVLRHWLVASCIQQGCAFGLALGLAAFVNAETFDEGIGASWHFNGDQFGCELRQDIAFYGDARFVQRAGYGLNLMLAPLRRQFAPGSVRLTRVAPAWHPLHPQRQSVAIIDHQPASALQVPDPAASRVLGELREGFDHHFQHSSQFHSERLQVVLRGQQMRAVYSDFLACQTALLPVNFDQVSRSRVHFDFDRDELTPASVERLQLVARYVGADSSITKVVLDGHTDGKGEMLYNQNLSARRANRVRDYLRSAGLADELFMVRYHGARYPVADNATQAGRADNRRTTVRLERGAAK